MTDGLTISWGDGDADALLRTVVAVLLATGPEAVVIGRACPRCGSAQHGRPVVVGHPEVFVSLSRASTTCVVVGTHFGPVGIDVEREGAAESQGTSTRDWVQEEAWRKADGAGVTGEPDDAATRWVHDLEAPDGFVAAVCVLGDRP